MADVSMVDPSQPAAPSIPPRVRTIAYFSGLAVAGAASMATGIAAAVAPGAATVVAAVCGAVTSGVAFVVSGLGVAFRPTR